MIIENKKCIINRNRKVGNRKIKRTINKNRKIKGSIESKKFKNSFAERKYEVQLLKNCFNFKNLFPKRLIVIYKFCTKFVQNLSSIQKVENLFEKCKQLKFRFEKI